ncbi:MULTISPECIES: NUDIX domain-containing protein [unclassified Acinetobacter]|uniref:NUDIX hydrolase n=1 Tax=unclassified Acinetobacter TaxID=196816 RepID=UPI002576FEC5|nr:MULTISPECIES: NUDIX domain-containing protein [unclassified Acinetobacter]MDM1762736.1 NUDIX domain-containing protein [Acinetobacter sp. 226-1]MDM1766215.1 NUDIX domain-containing protein [Acinetobacter sp. 226-4]
MSFHDFYRMSSHAVICNTQNEVLLLKATYADCAWGLPGGALDLGETIHAALIRECREEIGCDIQIDYLSGVYFHSVVKSHAFIFKCTLAKDAEIKLSEEHSMYQWFKLDELSAVQKIRIVDCLNFQGTVQSRVF